MFDCVFTTGRLKTPRDGNDDDDTKVRKEKEEKTFSIYAFGIADKQSSEWKFLRLIIFST